MTALAPAPFMVALMQVATSLPMVLLALPAGTRTDIVDRRRLLLVTLRRQLFPTSLPSVTWRDAIPAARQINSPDGATRRNEHAEPYRGDV
jgi:hypothetical protein